jgi:(2Fe-2S) ferredoxin
MGRAALLCAAAAAASIAAACATGHGAHPAEPLPGRDTFVRMERTECLGRCPIYTVTLYEDGVARYHGRRHALLGTRWRKIDPAEVTRIMDAAARIARWTCEPARIETDYPQSIVTVSRAGHPQLVPSVR